MEIKMEHIEDNPIFKEISKFLDGEGRLTLFPAKKRNKVIVLFYLASKFDADADYTEKQVNEIIDANHTFQDKWLLRREMVNLGLLCRLTDGSRYWLAKELPQIGDLLS